MINYLKILIRVLFICFCVYMLYKLTIDCTGAYVDSTQTRVQYDSRTGSKYVYCPACNIWYDSSLYCCRHTESSIITVDKFLQYDSRTGSKYVYDPSLHCCRHTKSSIR